MVFRKEFKHILYNPVCDVEMKTIETNSGRWYKTPKGKIVPSVTTVLKSRKDENSYLEDWKIRVGEVEATKILNIAGRRGTIFHDLCESYITNSVDFDRKYASCMPDSKESFLKAQPFIDRIDNIRYVETQLYSKKYRIAGRVDVFANFDDIPSIIDFKTSLVAKEESFIMNYFMQEYMYKMMIEEHHEVKIPAIVTINSALHENEARVFIKPAEKYRLITEKFLDDYSDRYLNETNGYRERYK